MVTVDEAVAGLVAKVPVMPAGHPAAARVTAELKPLVGLTVTVEVPVDPAVAVAGLAPNVKLGGSGDVFTGPKKIPLTTALPTLAASLIVTLPLISQTPYWPL
jgi:hypothetical protein